MLQLTMLANLMAISFASDQLSFDTVFQWKYINYKWPSMDALVQAIEDREYTPKHNVITGVKFWKDNMYLSLPRLKNGVPVTLAVTSARPLNGVTNPLLDPYPNWDMQAIGNCSAFQFVQSMEVDPLGRMWVLDTGRTGIMTSNLATRCPPRLIILDLENNGAILRIYKFPNNIALKDSARLNDIVLDHQDGGTAFITDSGEVDPGIIVYSLKDNVSWKIRDESMKAQDEAISFRVAGTTVSMPINVDGIALSPPGPDRLLYYSPVSSYHVYSVNVSVLKNSTLKKIDKYVRDLGRKSSQTDGMVMSNKDVLYFGLLNDDAIAIWDKKNDSHFAIDSTKVFTDHIHSQWPDTFAFDDDGRLWYVANALQNLLADNIDITKPNYRILSGKVQAKSYQYLRDGTAPELPVITAAAQLCSDTASKNDL